jgi:hypothetical protein|tara:strand:- start:714 stop:1184 length:471 start_codon:yes stop_codon:yes gene_type:complete
MFGFLTRKNTLLGILALVCVVSIHFYIKANSMHKVVVPGQSTFYTPGQHENCKWLVHFSNTVTTEEGDTSPAQIGIPEIIKDGYISGIIQNGPGKSLLLAFKIPTQSEKTPPIVLTSTYTLEQLPLKTISFRVFNSTVMRMVLYSSHEKCVEATMK